ncbi:MAG: hypothetical protein O7H39_00120, partial [Gammaproteobacteria bacterium]|nr:hypothetical protein [Gammaproteobacteria bacterium]
RREAANAQLGSRTGSARALPDCFLHRGNGRLDVLRVRRLGPLRAHLSLVGDRRRQRGLARDDFLLYINLRIEHW